MAIKIFKCRLCDPGCQKEVANMTKDERKICSRGNMHEANFVKVV